jgi:hypothetical protein
MTMCLCGPDLMAPKCYPKKLSLYILTWFSLSRHIVGENLVWTKTKNFGLVTHKERIEKREKREEREHVEEKREERE